MFLLATFLLVKGIHHLIDASRKEAVDCNGAVVPVSTSAKEASSSDMTTSTFTPDMMPGRHNPNLLLEWTPLEEGNSITSVVTADTSIHEIVQVYKSLGPVELGFQVVTTSTNEVATCSASPVVDSLTEATQTPSVILPMYHNPNLLLEWLPLEQDHDIETPEAVPDPTVSAAEYTCDSNNQEPVGESNSNHETVVGSPFLEEVGATPVVSIPNIQYTVSNDHDTSSETETLIVKEYPFEPEPEAENPESNMLKGGVGSVSDTERADTPDLVASIEDDSDGDFASEEYDEANSEVWDESFVDPEETSVCIDDLMNGVDAVREQDTAKNASPPQWYTSFWSEDDELEELQRDEAERVARLASNAKAEASDETCADPTAKLQQNVGDGTNVAPNAPIPADADDSQIERSIDPEVSLYPLATSTTPMVAYWALHFKAYVNKLKDDVVADHFSKDAVLRSACLTQAWEYLYEITKKDGVPLPAGTTGDYLPVKDYQPGMGRVKGIVVYPSGVRGTLRCPAPTKLGQVTNADEIPSSAASSAGSDEYETADEGPIGPIDLRATPERETSPSPPPPELPPQSSKPQLRVESTHEQDMPELLAAYPGQDDPSGSTDTSGHTLTPLAEHDDPDATPDRLTEPHHTPVLEVAPQIRFYGQCLG